MKILVCHNFYQQSGGEDRVFQDEVNVLKSKGHEVFTYTRHNDDLAKVSRFAAAVGLFWSQRTYKEVLRLIREHRPDIVQVHNFFPLISPSVFYAARTEHVPVVLTFHNPRLMCPSGNFMRKGDLCIACLGRRFAWPGVYHRCYRASFLFTCGIALMSFWHRWIGTWDRVLSGYIASTNFYRDLFIRHGIPAEKVHIKPHMVADDPGLSHVQGAYALFVGRLDPEKGAMTLIEAWKVLKDQGVAVPLKILGDGQMRQAMEKLILQHQLKDVSFLPRMSRQGLFDLMKGSRFLVWPSKGYYETFGLVAFEAYACGRPVIASNIGVLAEHVKDHETGLDFIPGDATDLARKVAWAWEHPEEMRQMGLAGRKFYEQGYTAQAVYERLIRIYQQLIDTQGQKL
jgi:glycosyltransferase involved in cell wall biosynthesis